MPPEPRGSEPYIGTERPSLLTNMSWLAVSNAAVKPFWFLFITAACMRYLGVEEYGVLSAAMSLTAIATSFVDLGMSQYSIREVSKDPDVASSHFTNFMSLRVANSMFGWIAALATAAVLGYQGSALGAVAFAGVYVFSLNLTEYCRSFYRAFEKLKHESILLVFEKILVVGGGLVFLLATQSAQWTLAGMAGGMVVITGVNMWWIHRRLAPVRPAQFQWTFLKKSLPIMIPFGLAGLFTNIYYKVDVVMIEAYLGAGPTGQYGAAYRILEALNALPTIVSIAAVYPRLARLHGERNHAAFRRLLKKSSAGLIGIGFVVAVVLTAFAPLVIRLLDPNPAFGASAGALQILVWSFPLLCANSLLYAALVTMDDQKLLAGFLGGAVVANIAMNVFLIPAYGIGGAAVATVASEVLLIVVYSARYVHRQKPSF
ncbi:MAG: flippase [Rhodothermales bacterium]